jgi:hypothetical protein
VRIQIGSQIREPLVEAGYTLDKWEGDEIVVRDESGRRELWVRNDHHAGYTLWFGGMGFEFVTGLSSR